MSQILNFDDLCRVDPPRDTVLAIGVFDGVHLGHQRLLRAALLRASDLECLPGAVTFYPHPRRVLLPQGGPGYLLSLEERLRLIEEQGIELSIVLSFTRELSRVSASDFVGALKRCLRVREMIVGASFALGRGREGTPSRLAQLGEQMGFAVRVIDPVQVDGVVVSSTAIRQAIEAGDVGLAAQLAGRPVEIEGEVARGAGRGSTLGFPTANLLLDPERVVPAYGVYAVRVHMDGRVCPGAASIGIRPTFDSGEPILEVYLLDFQGDLYGRRVRVEFVRRLRPEVAFASVGDLIVQMKRDVEQVRAILGVSAGCGQQPE